MGLFDVFKSGGSLQKHIAKIGNKRAQTHERWEAIEVLTKEGTEEAVEALISRFGFRVDPGITDQEEKEGTFQAIVSLGDTALGPVRAFLVSSETLAWPLKMLRALLNDEQQVTTELLGLLDTMDTEYERDPQKKVDILANLEERGDARITEAVRPFLEDVNETCRFHAIGAVLAQEDAEAAREDLIQTFVKEESVRVRIRLLDGFIAKGWNFGGSAADVSKKLPKGYSLNKQGAPKKS